MNNQQQIKAIFMHNVDNMVTFDKACHDRIIRSCIETINEEILPEVHVASDFLFQGINYLPYPLIPQICSCKLQFLLC
jgi:hypothetical protein